MDKITAKLIVSIAAIFVLLVGVAAGTSLVKRTQELREKAVLPVPNLTISPYSQTKTPNSTFSFQVLMDTGSESIAGVDLFLSYDPKAIQITSVTKGSGITSLETELVNNIDNTNGKVSYTAITQNINTPVQGSGLEVLKVNGVITSGASNKTYYIAFASGTTMGNVDGNNVLKAVGPGRIDVSSTSPTSTPLPTPTGGTIPSPTPTTGGGPTPTSGQVPDRYFFISPTSQSKTPGTSFSFTVRMNAASTSIAGLDVYVNFNPTALQVNSVTKGSGISGLETELVNQIDNTNGKISYTAITQNLANAVSGTNLEVLVVNGTVRSTASGGNYQISFAPQTTMGDTNGNNVLVGTLPGTISVGSGATSTPTPTSFIPTPTGPVEPADTIMYLEPSTLTVNNGSTFSLNLNIDSGVNDIVGVEAYLTFNPAVLQVVDIVPGGFFSNPIETVKQIDNTNGLISYVLHIPPESTPQTGVGTYAKITFKATAEGTSNVTITPDSIVGAVNAGGKNVLKSRSGATITVIKPSLLGDINWINNQCGDGKVDILDYVILFENFGEVPTDHPCADINGDGKVNILDYVILFENFGKTL